MELRPNPARAAAIVPFEPGPPLALPLFLERVPAGFASPADDQVDRVLDLNDLCVEHPAATYFVRVSGESMTGAGIHDGDVLVVDRSLEPRSGDVVVAALDGEHLVKRLRVVEYGGREGRPVTRRVYLEAEHAAYPSVEVKDGHDLVVWGVVTTLVHRFR
ncbi:MAG: translesion error-prone DNA polymerase V autoproteolytic subunit [Rhodothermales bacterium]|nr:translesion error-prone DNA polymerase V autoproteolytic subunit [Rhodothermales bacterium]